METLLFLQAVGLMSLVVVVVQPFARPAGAQASRRGQQRAMASQERLAAQGGGH
jgi:hypothetical protein